jgi:hypothetical protein
MAEEGQGTEGQQESQTDWGEANAEAQLASSDQAAFSQEAYTFPGIEAMDKATNGWLGAMAKDERATRAVTDPNAESRNRRIAYLRGRQKRQEQEERRIQDRIQRAQAFPPALGAYAKGYQTYERPRSGFWWHFLRGLLMRDPW